MAKRKLYKKNQDDLSKLSDKSETSKKPKKLIRGETKIKNKKKFLIDYFEEE